MDYQRIYDAFIADRRLKHPSIKRARGRELHHIKARCQEGGDEPGNLISLIYGDHLFAHLLLAKTHGGKLAVAFTYMVAIDRYQGRRTRLRHAKLMEESAKTKGLGMKGRKHTPAQAAALKTWNERRESKPMSTATREAMKPYWEAQKGRKAHPNALAAISRRGDDRSLAQKERDRKAAEANRSTPRSPAQLEAVKRLADQRRGKSWSPARRIAEETRKMRKETP